MHIDNINIKSIKEKIQQPISKHIHNMSEESKKRVKEYSSYIVPSFSPVYCNFTSIIFRGEVVEAYNIKSVKFDNNKESILFVHGFHGSSYDWYKVAEYLSCDYNVFCVDLIGNGLSSKPDNINFKNSQEWIDYFVEFMKTYIISELKEAYKNNDGIYSKKDNKNKNDSFNEETLKTNDMDSHSKDNHYKFHLFGHSFGGLISSWYAIKYPKDIIKLHLFSPAGITDTSIHGKDCIHKNKSYCTTFLHRLIPLIWWKKQTLQSIYKLPLMKYIIGKILYYRYNIDLLIEPDRVNFNKYMSLITQESLGGPTNLEKYIYYIFQNPIPSVIDPSESKLINTIRDCKLNVDFYFGSKDYMDTAGAKNIYDTFKEIDCFKINMCFIKDGLHTFIINNSLEVYENICKLNNISDRNLKNIKLRNADLK